jgi:hypothetical protein
MTWLERRGAFVAVCMAIGVVVGFVWWLLNQL